MEIQENQSLWDEAENELRKAGETTIVDFFKELLPSEYELEYLRHEQEWERIKQKLNYRLTIEGKKKILVDELDQTINYLDNDEEGEFRQVFGDLSQVTLDKVIDKIKLQANLIQKTTLWKDLNHNEKVFFLSIRNLPSNFIKDDLPFKNVYKEILRKFNLQLIIESEAV